MSKEKDKGKKRGRPTVSAENKAVPLSVSTSRERRQMVIDAGNGKPSKGFDAIISELESLRKLNNASK